MTASGILVLCTFDASDDMRCITSDRNDLSHSAKRQINLRSFIRKTPMHLPFPKNCVVRHHLSKKIWLRNPGSRSAGHRCSKAPSCRFPHLQASIGFTLQRLREIKWECNRQITYYGLIAKKSEIGIQDLRY